MAGLLGCRSVRSFPEARKPASMAHRAAAVARAGRGRSTAGLRRLAKTTCPAQAIGASRAIPLHWTDSTWWPGNARCSRQSRFSSSRIRINRPRPALPRATQPGPRVLAHDLPSETLPKTRRRNHRPRDVQRANAREPAFFGKPACHPESPGRVARIGRVCRRSQSQATASRPGVNVTLRLLP